MRGNQGVVVPQGQLRSGERGEPHRVVNVLEAKLIAVEYNNAQGVPIKEFWYRVGDTFYIPPGAETFASQLRPVKGSHAAQVLAKLAAQSSGPNKGLPVEDAVDVVSTQTAEEQTVGDVDV